MELSIGNYKSPNNKLYTELQSVTIANTTTELSLVSSSLLLPAYSLQIGTNIRAELMGKISVTGNPDSTIRVYLGTTPILVSTGKVTSGLVNAYFHSISLFTVRSVGVNGTIIGHGDTTIKQPDTIGAAGTRAMVSLAPIIINTQQALPFSTTYQWSVANAGNSITVDVATVEIF